MFKPVNIKYVSWFEKIILFFVKEKISTNVTFGNMVVDVTTFKRLGDVVYIVREESFEELPDHYKNKCINVPCSIFRKRKIK